jgi:cellobiose-specific phosphotransferase system component IIC
LVKNNLKKQIAEQKINVQKSRLLVYYCGFEADNSGAHTAHIPWFTPCYIGSELGSQRPSIMGLSLVVKDHLLWAPFSTQARRSGSCDKVFNFQ